VVEICEYDDEISGTVKIWNSCNGWTANNFSGRFCIV